MTPVAKPRLRLLAALLLLFLTGVLFRFPTLELPLEGEGARLATRAHVLVGGPGEPGDWDGARSRLQAWVTAPWTLLLPTPTIALRTSTLVLGALVAPLLLLLGLRLGAPRPGALAAAWLTALHPALAYGAVKADSSALGGACLLASALGLLGSGPLPRRVGALLAAMLPLAYALATPAAVLLVALFVRRERSTLWRILAAALLIGAVLLTPLPTPPDGAPPFGARLLALLLQWVPIAVLVVFLPGLAQALGRVVRGRAGRDVAPAVAVGGGAFLLVVATLALDGGSGFRFSEAGLGAALPAVPVVLLAGVAGRVGSSPRSRAVVAIAVVGALILSLGVVSAPLQTTFRPRAPGLAGRLQPLGDAVRAAAVAAGDGGWVSLDAPGLDLATRVRLMDFAERKPLLVAGPLDDRVPLPEGEILKQLSSLVVVSRRETWPAVATLDGRGIFQTEVLDRHGPWVVVRLVRT